MHYEVVTDKHTYVYSNYLSALNMFNFLKSSKINCVLKSVYKSRKIKN